MAASWASGKAIRAAAVGIMETPSGYCLNPGVVCDKPGQGIGAAISAQKGCFALRGLSVIGRFPVRRHLPVLAGASSWTRPARLVC
jgi:hypothetical protein